ncbi:MAG: DUF4252 domain-containing protein [Prevotella sp.]|nr:DUF4252 domain-containing protein [Prevotellaceae bacterium]MDY3935683.1 DUF4252 domain-containing protein [Prevotella sp.]
MKRILLILLMGYMANSGFAQVKSLMCEFKHTKGAEYHFVPKLALKIAGSLVSQAEEGDEKDYLLILKHLSAVRTLCIEKSTAETREKISKAMHDLSKKGYQVIVESNNEGEHTLVMVKKKRNKVRELVVFDVDKDECNLVQIKGSISQQDIQQILDKDNSIIIKKKKKS